MCHVLGEEVRDSGGTRPPGVLPNSASDSCRTRKFSIVLGAPKAFASRLADPPWRSPLEAKLVDLRSKTSLNRYGLAIILTAEGPEPAGRGRATLPMGG